MFVVHLCCHPHLGQQTHDQGWSLVVRSARKHLDWTPAALKCPVQTPQSDNWRSGGHHREWWRPANTDTHSQFPGIPCAWKDGWYVPCQTHLFFDSSAHAVQVSLTHQTEGSHLPPQEHHIILKRDESVTRNDKWHKHSGLAVYVRVLPYWHCPLRL